MGLPSIGTGQLRSEGHCDAAGTDSAGTVQRPYSGAGLASRFVSTISRNMLCSPANCAGLNRIAKCTFRASLVSSAVEHPARKHRLFHKEAVPPAAIGPEIFAWLVREQKQALGRRIIPGDTPVRAAFRPLLKVQSRLSDANAVIPERKLRGEDLVCALAAIRMNRGHVRPRF
jgi:hypothetical protein